MSLQIFAMSFGRWKSYQCPTRLCVIKAAAKGQTIFFLFMFLSNGLKAYILKA